MKLVFSGQKNSQHIAGYLEKLEYELKYFNAVSLRAFLTLRYSELNFLTFD